MSNSTTPKSRTLGDAPIDIEACAHGISECVARMEEIERRNFPDHCVEKIYSDSEVEVLYDRQDMLEQAISFVRCKTPTEAAIQLAMLSQMTDSLCASNFADVQREEMQRRARRLEFSLLEYLTSQGAKLPARFADNYAGENLNPWISTDAALAYVIDRVADRRSKAQEVAT